jgi:hypothetical protein
VLIPWLRKNIMHPSSRQKVTFLSTLSVFQPHHHLNNSSVNLDQTPSTLKTQLVRFSLKSAAPANIKPTAWKIHNVKKLKLIIIYVSRRIYAVNVCALAGLSIGQIQLNENLRYMVIKKLIILPKTCRLADEYLRMTPDNI